MSGAQNYKIITEKKLFLISNQDEVYFILSVHIKVKTMIFKKCKYSGIYKWFKFLKKRKENE